MPLLHDLLEAAITSATAGTTVACDRWADHLTPYCEQYQIDSRIRIAAFIAQVSVESEGFAKLEEGLNYSAAGLLKCWPTRFVTWSAASCAHKPELIANVVYANRMGNGNAASGDGWRYRGSGLIQLTGKSMHLKFAEESITPYNDSDCLRSPQGAAESACWFWNLLDLNTLADAWEITAISKKINGGTNGLAQRLALSNQIRKALEL